MGAGLNLDVYNFFIYIDIIDVNYQYKVVSVSDTTGMCKIFSNKIHESSDHREILIKIIYGIIEHNQINHSFDQFVCTPSPFEFSHCI